MAVVMHFVAPRANPAIELHGLGLDRLAAMIEGFLVTFSVRVLATTLGWSLPIFRESATRERWKNARKDSGRV